MLKFPHSIFIIIPAIIISILFLIWIGILSWGIRSLFKKWCYFVSTPTRLIKYQNNTIKSIDWWLILSDIEIKWDNKKGSIVLKMKENINISDIPEDYNPETLNITDIPNLYEIEQICRKRIKENMHL